MLGDQQVLLAPKVFHVSSMNCFQLFSFLVMYYIWRTLLFFNSNQNLFVDLLLLAWKVVSSVPSFCVDYFISSARC